jgi:hypothetical protein
MQALALDFPKSTAFTTRLLAFAATIMPRPSQTPQEAAGEIQGFRTERGRSAFIHDEFIIELSSAIDIDKAAGEIADICSDSMQPFVPGIPVPCEYALTDRWHKGAEAVYDESGRLQVWRPPSSNGGFRD